MSGYSEHVKSNYENVDKTETELINLKSEVLGGGSNFIEIDGSLETYTKVKEIIDSALYFKPVMEIRLTGNEFTPHFERNEEKEEFTRYIMQGKLGSGENPKMEEIYEKIMLENTDCSWKLEYIKEHRGKNISDIIKQIKEEESDKYISMKSRELEEQRLNELPDASRKLLPKGGKILSQGRHIFTKTMDGIIQYIGERVGRVDRFFKPKSKIKSAPIHTESYIDKTGEKKTMTYCSKTAQKNAQTFGIKIPSGNGRKGVEQPPEDKQHFVESKDKQGNNNNYIQIDPAPLNANFADISVKSFTKNGIKFGHRAVAFLDTSNQWYVLDPYYSGGKGINPIPLTEYPKRDLIERINYYNAPLQSTSV